MSALYKIEHCTSLKSICIPCSVTKIGSFAFAECDSLESVVLPKSENYSIEEAVFEHCCSLKTIHSKAQLPSIHTAIAAQARDTMMFLIVI